MSHANSQKQHQNQLSVCTDICNQLAGGEDRLFGVMIESNLVAGNPYGQSITDACIDWDDSAKVLEQLAQANAKRQAAT